MGLIHKKCFYWQYINVFRNEFKSEFQNFNIFQLHFHSTEILPYHLRQNDLHSK